MRGDVAVCILRSQGLIVRTMGGEEKEANKGKKERRHHEEEHGKKIGRNQEPCRGLT